MWKPNTTQRNGFRFFSICVWWQGVSSYIIFNIPVRNQSAMLSQISKPVFIFLSSIKDRVPQYNRKRWNSKLLLTNKIYLRNARRLLTQYWFSLPSIILCLDPSFSANISDQGMETVEIYQNLKLKIRKRLGVKVDHRDQPTIVLWICLWSYMLLDVHYQAIPSCIFSMIAHHVSTTSICLWSG